jgi:hypothetical protein
MKRGSDWPVMAEICRKVKKRSAGRTEQLYATRKFRARGPPCKRIGLYWPPTPTRKYGYETTEKPTEVTVIAVDARSRL